MDLIAHMVTFVRVVETGSLTAAARVERSSLTAVSRKLSALEAELGTPLILRSTRKLSITDAGRLWYERSVAVLREVEDARAAVQGSSEVKGTLVVSASLTIGTALVLPKMPVLAKRHPGLVVDLRLEDRLVDLVADGVDLALRGGAPVPDTTAFIAHPLLRFPRFLVASPAYLKKRGAPADPSDLARHDCLLQDGPASGRDRFTLVRAGDESVERTVDVRAAFRTNAPLALRELCCASMGVALLPEWLVAEALTTGKLARVLPDWTSPLISIQAFHRAGLKGNPRIRAFLDVMRSSKGAA